MATEDGGQVRPAPPSRQQSGAYLCYALAPQGGWLQPVEVASAQDAWRWVANPLRAPFDELRVTDATGEDCLIHIVGDELKFPTHVECQMNEEVWRAFWDEFLEPRIEARRMMRQ